MHTHFPPYWGQHLTAVFGAPQRAESELFWTAWGYAESGGSLDGAKWNPINTKQAIPGFMLADWNPEGVKQYAFPVVGVAATAATLCSHGPDGALYGHIVGAIQNGTLTAQEILDRSKDQITTWGTNVDAIAASSQEFVTPSEAELEIRQNELYLAMGVVEEMPASEAQTACITKLAERMRRLVELRGKSEVGRSLNA